MAEGGGTLLHCVSNYYTFPRLIYTYTTTQKQCQLMSQHTRVFQANRWLTQSLPSTAPVADMQYAVFQCSRSIMAITALTIYRFVASELCSSWPRVALAAVSGVVAAPSLSSPYGHAGMPAEQQPALQHLLDMLQELLHTSG